MGGLVNLREIFIISVQISDFAGEVQEESGLFIISKSNICEWLRRLTFAFIKTRRTIAASH